MYSWVVGRVIRRLFAQLSAGDAGPVLRAFTPDARFVFPGNSSFAADTRDRGEIEAWFRRFVALGPTFEIHDVLVSGPPWNMRAAVRFTDRFPLPDGSEYENHGMQYLRLSWGRVTEDRLHVDTARVAELDALLAAHEAG
jgi:ketosteroid isomerase-like protein